MFQQHHRGRYPIAKNCSRAIEDTLIKRSLLLLIVLVTTACAGATAPDRPATSDGVETAIPPAEPTTSPLPFLAPAPDWNNDVWINTDSPLRLADVQGKVVLLEFWTFG